MSARAKALAPALAPALSAVAVGFAIVLAAPGVVAEDRRVEAAARVALNRAETEYATMDFEKALARLVKADRACGANKCRAATKAALARDVGMMHFRLGDRDAALASFATARRIDPKIALNPSYDAPDVRAVWQGASGAGSGGAASSGGAPSTQPSGDFAHTPAGEQSARTPLPIYVEYAGRAPVTSVVVKYKGEGMDAYKRLELARVGEGWGALIPCGDVTLGTMRYYVQGFDKNGEPLIDSGDPKRPFTVAIRPSITSAAPHLPGRDAPAACDESGACSPGAPGCGGDTHEASTSDDKDAPHETDFARVWIGVAGSIDFVSLPAADDACKLDAHTLPTNAAGYYCTSPNGADFPSRSRSAENASLAAGNGGHVDGGLSPGDVRVMLTFDYAISASLLLGARVGFVAHAYPGDAGGKDGRAFFAPLHAELRGTFVFGDAPLAHAGFAPYAFVGGGVAEFDAKEAAWVTQTGIVGQKVVQAWLLRGPGFVAFGGGGRYAFSPRAALLAALKVNAAFGSGGVLPTFGPELALQFGF